MLKYCNKCGAILDDHGNHDETMCKFCSNELKQVPEKYLKSPEFYFIFGDGMREKLLQELIFPSSNFEQTAYDEREKDIIQHSNDWQKIKAVQQQASNIPKCPTCQSTNIEKISLTSKVVGGALFGLFSSNVRNTMHCKNCGHKW